MSSSNIGDLWHSRRREVGVDFGQTLRVTTGAGRNYGPQYRGVSAPEEDGGIDRLAMRGPARVLIRHFLNVPRSHRHEYYLAYEKR